jgi:excisionase family DNA binding protein
MQHVHSMVTASARGDKKRETHVSELLFVIGAGLLIVGRVRFGRINAEGPRVRSAGLLLTMPLVIRLLLSFVVNAFSRGDAEALSRGMSIVGTLELLTMIGAVAFAYASLARETMQSTPGPTIVQRPPQQSESRPDQPSETSGGAPDDVSGDAPTPPPAPPRSAPNKPSPMSASQRRQQPSVMTTAEAARYLNISEQAVMDLIKEGKITAARINYRYRISKTVLDEFMQDQQTGPATE